MNGPVESFAQLLSKTVEAQSVSYRSLAAACSERGAPVSAPTLRSWASGQSFPRRRNSFDTVAALEQILGLDYRRLQRLLELESFGPPPEDPSLTALFDREQRIRDAYGIPPSDHLVHQAQITTAHIADGGSAILRQRLIAETAAPGVGTVLLMMQAGHDVGAIDVSGGTLTAVEELGDDRLGLVMRLARPLDTEELVLIDVQAATTVDLGSADRVAAMTLVPCRTLAVGLRSSFSETRHMTQRRRDFTADGTRDSAWEVTMFPGMTGTQLAVQNAQLTELEISWETNPKSCSTA